MATRSRELPWFSQPVIKAMPACVGCGAFRPECLVPDDSGALPMCWLCAHAHVDHECALSECVTHRCECLPEAIYPERVLQKRRG